MADPMTLAAATGFLAVGGGQIGTGFMAQRDARRNAKQLLRMGQIEAEEARRRGRALEGAQRVAFAKAGVDPTGSALDVALDTAVETELTALREQFGFEQAAFAERTRGRQAAIRGVTSALGTAVQAGTILGRSGG